LDRDDESDSERDYKRKKKKKGDAAYAEYLQSKIDNDHDLGEGGGTAQRKDLYNNPTMNSDDDDDSDKDDLDKKPAAKVRLVCIVYPYTSRGHRQQLLQPSNSHFHVLLCVRYTACSHSKASANAVVQRRPKAASSFDDESYKKATSQLPDDNRHDA